MKKLRGPDLSEFNGNVNFDRLKANADFVILRCGYGGNYLNQEDTKFSYYASECERCGIPYGVYLYSYAKSTEAAEDEARHALSLIGGKNVSLGVWYDLEDDALPSNQNALTDIALAFCKEIKNSGYFAGIYTSLSWINNRFDDSRLDGIGKWIAQWNDSFDYGGNALMWQFTNHAELEGIPYACDCNLAENELFDLIDENKQNNTQKNGSEEEKGEEKTLVVTADIGLNVRKKPSENSPVKDVLKFGDIIRISETKNDGSLVWGKLSYPKKFKNCYAAVSYCSEIRSIDESFTVTADIGLNVRLAPSMASEIKRALSKGTRVSGKHKYKNWVKISSPVGGWVCADYLE